MILRLCLSISGDLQAGQAVMELALILPVLLILMMGVMQLALICQVNLLVHMAVRHAVEIHWQGGTKKQIEQEVTEYIRRYPFMADQKVSITWRKSLLDEQVRVSCRPPIVLNWISPDQMAPVQAEMTIGRELFCASRIPGPSNLIDIISLGDKIRGSR